MTEGARIVLPGRRPGGGTKVSRFGNFEVDVRSRELTRAGARVRLQGQPFQLLVVLLERPGEVITREELRQRLWPTDTFVQFDAGLNVAVRKVRRALGDSAESPRFVETVPRLADRFLAEVCWLELVAPAAGESPQGSVGREPAATGDPQRWAARVGGVSARYGLIPLVAGALLWWGAAPSNPPTSSGLRPLTMLPGFQEHSPAFSPDGRLVAFARAGPGEDYGIHLAQVDGGSVLRLTRGRHDWCPDWSPDGGSIAFTRLWGDEPGIYLVPALEERSGGFIRSPLRSGGFVPIWRGLGTGSRSPSPSRPPEASTEASSCSRSPIPRSGRSARLRPDPVPAGTGLLAHGRSLAFIRSKAARVAELFVMPAGGGEARQLAPHDHRILYVSCLDRRWPRAPVRFRPRRSAKPLARARLGRRAPRRRDRRHRRSRPYLREAGAWLSRQLSDTGAIWRIELGRGAPPTGSAPRIRRRVTSSHRGCRRTAGELRSRASTRSGCATSMAPTRRP